MNSSFSSQRHSSIEETQEGGPPSDALVFVLPYLPVHELLVVSRVCRSLRDTVNGDELIWMNLTVDKPLNSRLTDYSLMKIASKAAGKLRTLAMKKCIKVTDDGLQQVIEQNPLISKLHLPGCTGLTPEGVIRAVQTLNKHHTRLVSLKISGIYNLTKDHLEVLQSCLHDLRKISELHPRPSLYHEYENFLAQIPEGNDLPIDVEICPRCDFARMVFDCSRASCRIKKGCMTECRGCYFCIPRCEECGGCAEDPEEAACADVLCSDCWFQLHKCNHCNKPYCRKHAVEQHQSSTGFLCGVCHIKFVNDVY